MQTNSYASITLILAIFLLIKMATIISNFTVPQRFCLAHDQVCSFVCLQERQARMKIICNKCLINSNLADGNANGNLKLFGIQKFRQFLGGIVSVEEGRLAGGDLIDIRRLINEKKQEFEQKQFKILSVVMKKLSQDKEKLFSELDGLQKILMAKESKYSSNIIMRREIVTYLKEFSIDQQLLRLKIMLSNDFGLNNFFSQIKSLQHLSQQFMGRNHSTEVQQIKKELQRREEGTFLANLQNFFRKTVDDLMLIPIIDKPKSRLSYRNQISQRRNQSQQNIPLQSTRASRQQSFAQLPRFAFG